jgi:LmbE family N-acetylglucosaminyl deacetylase
MATETHDAAPAAAQAARALADWLSAAPLASGARVLVLGAAARPIAARLLETGHEVVEGGEADLPALPEAPAFDAAVVAGFVEREPWDRWALQRLHGVIREDGLLLVIAPNLYRLAALVRPGYVTGKLAKKFPALAAITGRDATTAGDRSYASGALRATLEGLGFAVVAEGPPASAADGWLPASLRASHVLLARRRPVVFGVDPGRPFPEGHTHRSRFERRHHDYLRVRDTWARRHAAVVAASGTPRALEPERYAGASVLVLSPHPDDELIGCGGTLLRLRRAGARVTILHATDGSASAALEREPASRRPFVRLDEAKMVARAAGFETIVWGEDNRAFIATRDLVARLRDTIRGMAPALLFTPFVTDDHPDHLTLNRILGGALKELAGAAGAVAGRAGVVDASAGARAAAAAAAAVTPPGGTPAPEILGYEVWGFVPANRWCDVSDEEREVARLLHLYPTAMKVDDFVHQRADRGYAHALALSGRPGFAEAFFAADPATWRALIDDLIR